ncbi:MAG: tripartite tricarboxylate transporter TctB family protein [Thermodesulfobacteriota bacterium]
MARKETVVTLILLVYSLVYFLGSLSMSVGTLDNPGHGVVPRVVGLLLLLFTGTLLYRLIRKRMTGGRLPEARHEEVEYLGPLGIVACVLLYPLLLGGLKFLLATFIILFVMLRALRFRKAAGSALIAAGATLVTFLVFTKVLGVVFPGGPLEHYVYALF